MLRSVVTALVSIALIVAVPFVLLWLVRFYFNVVEPYRKQRGYVVTYFGGREPGDGISVTYYERDKELHFFSDRDEKTFYIPSEDLWDRTMPEFFKGRRELIVQRLTRRIPKRVAVKAIDIYDGDRSILYVDQSKTGSAKVLNIGNAA